jgi:hypothetical protein
MGVYQPDEKGFTELALGPKMHEFIMAAGEHWAAELRASAPRDPPENEYVNSITVEAVPVFIKGRARVAAEIKANVLYAAILEVGSKHIQDPPRPMTKLLDRIQAADPFRHKR